MAFAEWCLAFAFRSLIYFIKHVIFPLTRGASTIRALQGNLDVFGISGLQGLELDLTLMHSRDLPATSMASLGYISYQLISENQQNIKRVVYTLLLTLWWYLPPPHCCHHCKCWFCFLVSENCPVCYAVVYFFHLLFLCSAVDAAAF